MTYYNHKDIEPKWQAFWADNHTFKTGTDSTKPNFYALDMFPYPSGAGLHVGHPEGYTATDILSRYKRAQGYNVLHPMGWDAFGLPAEQYAMDTGNDPAEFTAENIANFKRQINALGFSYDWDREINTTDPDYYKWTQWIFTKLYEKGLAYEAEVPVNWVEELGTAIANEEVLPDGTSERGGYPVVRKPMRQWMLKITAYAERLLNDLDELDWPESIKDMQRNWIGKSTGAHVDFKVAGTDKTFTVYTTRPDTLFGATYAVLAPEHELVDAITTSEQAEAVADYKHQASLKSDLARTDLAKEKTGVWTGAYAINPVNGREIPIWIADYVLSQTPGSTVSNLSSSRALRDVTVAHGCQYTAAAVGEVNVVTEMKRTGAVIGGEGNGGVIYPESHYGRDALVGVALFLTLLAKSGKKVSELKKTYPQYSIAKNKIQLTPDIDVDAILKAVKEHYASEKITDIDGVKIDFADCWVHLRKSNTEPIIRIYSEASTMEKAESLAEDMKKVIASLSK